MLDTGEQAVKLRFGSTTCTLTAAVAADSAAVTHGIGAVPVALVATAVGGGNETKINVTVKSVGATTFVATARYADEVARTATVTVYWIALG